MTQPSPHIDHYLAEFARLERSLAGATQDGVARERHARLKNFAKTGFPATQQEAWKYTDLRALEKRRFEGSEEAPTVGDKVLDALLPANLDAHRFVLVDGHFESSLSRLDALPDGVTLRSVAQALEDGDETVTEWLSSRDDEATGAFGEMNRAFVSDGLFLQIDAGTTLDRPLLLVHYSSGRNHEFMQHCRHLLRLGDNAGATVIEQYCGDGEEDHLSNTITDVQLSSGARLHRYRLQEESRACYHVSALLAEQARDSVLINHSADLGGRLSRVDTRSHLHGNGATAELYGVYAPDKRQHMDNHTEIDHDCEHGVSREAFRGLASGRGRGVFNGRILIRRDAQKTDSELSSDALLLSPRAEIDAKPELEIYADDVKAAHGSTVGQLDEDAIFYLRSRGIDDDGARAMLVASFADELLGQWAPEALQQHVRRALLTRLPDGARYADFA